SANIFSGLYSGSYTVHIKDANNCQLDTLVHLPDSIRVDAVFQMTDVLCHGDSTGSITVTANSATAPYQYALLPGAPGSNNVFNLLPAGIYNFHITDVNLCYLDTTVEIKQPDSISSSTILTDLTCKGGSDGAATVTASGGTAPYIFAIDNGPFSVNNVFTGLTE